MRNSVHAFDADNPSKGRVLWHVTLGTPVPAQLLYGQYGDITPDVGILSTGVIDRARGVLYVVAEVLERGRPAFYLHALDLASGFERLNGPVAITGSVDALDFDPMQHIQRPALLLANDAVRIAFGSHGDQGAYHGWMLSYDAADLRRSTGAYVTTPDGNGGAIWQSGRGPAADRQGNIYAISANGDYDGLRNFGQSFVKLNTAATATLDSYTPADWKEMSDNDFDLSAGPALITGTHTVIGADKLGNLYAIDGDAMRRAGHAAVVSASEASIFNFAVWSSGTAARVYTQGGREPLKCFLVTPDGINPDPLYTAESAIPYARIGLTISANGDTPGSGILWESAGNYNESSTPGALYAYDAGSLELLWSSDMNPARDRMPPVSKFVAPTVANGRVYVASSANVVTVYGLYAAVDDPVSAPSISAVANAASNTQGAIAPGELVAVLGSDLGPDAPADVSGVQVLFDGVAGSVVFASATQLNVVVPFELGGPVTMVQVQFNGLASAQMPVSVVPAAIGVFSADTSGSGAAIALNADGSVNSADRPAAPGSVVTVWATGAGAAVDARVLTAQIDGQDAEILAVGAGTIRGVIQVNVRIPAGAAAGALPVLLRVGESVSQSGITVAVSDLQ
jgi:uncharacterized protein (TIGR03437 family)